jgi:hypothetical protein
MRKSSLGILSCKRVIFKKIIVRVTDYNLFKVLIRYC